MAKQFNAIIATQNVHFRGTSSIPVTNANFKAITGARYAANVTGTSGLFSIQIVGSIGGTTYTIAGLTSITSGNHMLYPQTYGANGVVNAIEGAKSIATQQIDSIVPPSHVVFESIVATAGISTTAVVSAVITER